MTFHPREGRHTPQRITRAVEGWENNINTDWRS
jgi:hypothetical protein